jgi:hypothetical protein
MGRPVKPGLTYFSLDTNTYTDKKVRLFLSDFPTDDRLKIFAIYILLISRVYEDKGYYLEWDADARNLFCADLNIDTELCDDIITSAIKRKLFCDENFKKKNILTSAGIIKRYLRAPGRRAGVILQKTLVISHEIGVVLDLTGVIDTNNSSREREREGSKVKTSNTKKTCEHGHTYLGDSCLDCVIEENKRTTA